MMVYGGVGAGMRLRGYKLRGPMPVGISSMLLENRQFDQLRVTAGTYIVDIFTLVTSASSIIMTYRASIQE